MQNSCVLILSCDKYSFLWKPCFYQFWKYWKNCPYPVYLGSNTIPYNDDKRVKTILSGKDSDWSTSFISILKQIPQENIFIWLDDTFITSFVDTSFMQKCFDLLENENVQHIHNKPKIPPDTIAFGGQFGKYERGMPYRVTLIGFWKKQSLLKLLLPGENPWSFEIYGSYRSSNIDGFYCSLRKIFDYLHVVEKGKIFKSAIQFCIKNNIPLDIGSREIIGGSKKIISDVKEAYFRFTVSVIHWKIRTKILSILRKIFISY